MAANFNDALYGVKAGKKWARPEWEDTVLEIQRPEGDPAFIAKVGPDGTGTPYAAESEDMLAEDWQQID